MAFDQTTRNPLQRSVNDARRVLEEEFTCQLQNDYGMDPNAGTVAELSSLRRINDAQRETARILRDSLAHYTAGGETDRGLNLAAPVADRGGPLPDTPNRSMISVTEIKEAAMEQIAGRGGARPRAGRPAGKPTKVVRLPVPVADLARRVAQGPLRAGGINVFLDVEARIGTTVPLMSTSVRCGFPSPADDHLDRPLDFNELLIDNPAATFAVRIAGDSMTGVGIFPGDIAVVDRSMTAVDGSIVLALLDGEFTIKRYRRKGDRVWLQAENPAYAELAITEGSTLEVWGVIRSSIRML